MPEENISQMLISGQDDLEWFNSNLDDLKSKYDNMFVAFHNRKIIGADNNLDNLIKFLEKKSIDTSDIFVKFVSKVKIVL